MSAMQERGREHWVDALCFDEAERSWAEGMADEILSFAAEREDKGKQSVWDDFAASKKANGGTCNHPAQYFGQTEDGFWCWECAWEEAVKPTIPATKERINKIVDISEARRLAIVECLKVIVPYVGTASSAGVIYDAIRALLPSPATEKCEPLGYVPKVGETWMVTRACKEHKHLGTDYAFKKFRWPHDANPCKTGCVYERVEATRVIELGVSYPAHPPPQDQECDDENKEHHWLKAYIGGYTCDNCGKHVEELP